MVEPITLFAPAKLNLGLEILGRRDDGYHELATILQTVSIFDQIELLPSERLRYEPVAGMDRDADLVWRALEVAERRIGVRLVAEVRLVKRIPLAAGLGGGSSDAGTLLGGLVLLAGLPAAGAIEAAAELGSDVPFFVRGGTAAARGTGTDLSPLPDLQRLWFVVVTPDVAVPEKTRTLYRELGPEDFSDGAATRALEALIAAGDPIDTHLLRNSFSRPLYRRPRVCAAARALASAGAAVVLPGGAGPSLFAPVDRYDEARRLASGVRRHGYQGAICTTVRDGANDARLTRARLADR